MTDQYFDWLLNFLGFVLLVAIVLPLWLWPFDYWPLGVLGGFSVFIWVAMLAMDWIERKTGYYWPVKIGALIILMAFASFARAGS